MDVGLQKVFRGYKRIFSLLAKIFPLTQALHVVYFRAWLLCIAALKIRADAFGKCRGN